MSETKDEKEENGSEGSEYETDGAEDHSSGSGYDTDDNKETHHEETAITTPLR